MRHSEADERGRVERGAVLSRQIREGLSGETILEQRSINETGDLKSCSNLDNLGFLSLRRSHLLSVSLFTKWGC